MIRLENITFHYNKVILDDINLNIDKNKITFIVGTNGSGKSTLANMISGLLFPQKGNIYLDNIKLDKKTSNKLIRSKVGMVFQNPSNQIIFSRVYDDIKFTLENMDVPKEDIANIIKESLMKVNMLDKIDANPYQLSGGEKQRIAIASQLSLHPDYLIFDEATSMLDINGKKDIYQLIKELKNEIGIIFITNNMDELIYADDVIIISHKKVYRYELKDILKDQTILAKHHLDIPFIFKIAKALHIKNVKDFNENSIIERLEDS